MELQLDHVEARRHLRDGMFHLQSCVDFEEGELLTVRLVQELDRAGVGVAGEPRQTYGCSTQVSVLLGGQNDALRLFDHLLIATLHAASRTPGAHTVP